MHHGGGVEIQGLGVLSVGEHLRFDWGASGFPCSVFFPVQGGISVDVLWGTLEKRARKVELGKWSPPPHQEGDKWSSSKRVETDELLALCVSSQGHSGLISGWNLKKIEFCAG